MNLKNVEDVYPLSPLQQGMLFHTLDAPQSGVYFVQLVFTLRGHLDAPAFRKVWQRVVERHAALRTAFFWEGLDEPLQVVRNEVELPWALSDWQALPADERTVRLEAFLQTDREQGFDLTQAPLMRCALLQVSEDTCWFVWTYHHLVLDGWSWPLVLDEALSFYRGRQPGPDTPRPHRDYIAWLQQQDLAEAEAFWRRALHGFAAPTRLAAPQAGPGRARPGGASHEQHLRLPAPSTTALVSMAREQRLTLNTLVQGAWALLLNRYSGESDVVFGATVSGRPVALPGAEFMVGLCINTLPVRVRVSGEARLLTWLQALQAEQVEREQYSYSPLVEVQGWSDVPRGAPLFETLLVVENYPVRSPREEGDGLKVVDFRCVERTHYPLTVMVIPGPELSVRIQFEEGRFEVASVTGMLGHFRQLLECMAANPRQRLAELPLLTGAEWERLRGWNATGADYPRHLCVHQLFEAQVGRTPNAVAVTYEDQHLTYRELDCRANRLAHRLRRRGVGPDVRVGICVERSLDLAVAVMGILKAGGAYVPLDLAHPRQRLGYVLADARVAVLVTQQRLLAGLPVPTPPVLALDVDSADDPPTEAPPASDVAPANLAYVIYTSGSTGAPKGVAVSHQAVVNFLTSMKRRPGLTEQDRLLAVTTFSFDIAGLELYLPLLAGARIVLASPETAADGARLLESLDRWGVTVMQATPATWQLLLSAGWRGSPRLTILCGGDALPRPLAGQLRERGAALWNMYGPTETTVWSALYPVEAHPRSSGDGVEPIGRPIANTQLYVLDDQGRPVPPGVPGELYIGGEGLARGYLHRPELTAERFLPDPFGAKPGARLYRTGDRARQFPDGNLEFLGRLDHQVKIRGFRVELAEIEAVLERYPDVREAIAVTRADWNGEQCLVAYVVHDPKRAVSRDDLRRHLRRELPDYMVPSAVVPMMAWPLTPNRKIDRQALPAPDGARPLAEETFVAPRTSAEEVVAGIWAEVLGVDRVGAHDSFFDLGGHSLKATRVLARVQDAFRVKLPVRSLFEAPTVAGLSERVEQARRGTLAGAPAIGPVPLEGSRSQTPPISFSQQRLWFLDRLTPDSALYNIPWAVRFRGDLNVAALRQALGGVVERHESLRTTFGVAEGSPVQIIAAGASVGLPVIDLSGRPDGERQTEVERLANEEARRPFDLTRGPLLRATLFRLAEQEYVFLVTAHHIVFDGWSSGVFLRELSALYCVITAGTPLGLREPHLQYADFSRWQRQWLQGGVLEGHLSYWKQQLALPTVLQIPTDRPRPPVQTFRGASESFVLPAALSAALKALSRREGTTLFMTLLAAFQTLLHRYTDQSDILVGSPIANRPRTELEELIGLFVNTLVLRTDLSGNPSFRDLLGRVREVTLDADAHQDLPFEMLVEELQPERNLSYTPLFQVMFVFQNTPSARFEAPGVTVSPVGVSTGTAKFDLTLALEETGAGLVGGCEYSTELFEPATITRMLGHFETLLEGIVADPGRRLSDLPLLTTAVRRQVLALSCGDRVDYPQGVCLHELVEEQVGRTPGAVALAWEGGELTYRQLGDRANRLAGQLRNLGVGPDALVGVCLERGPALVVALLATLKAGGAYVPLDPDHPRDRLAGLLADAGVAAVLTDRGLAGRLPPHSAPRLYLDADGAAEADAVGDTRGAAGHPGRPAADNLAYVIYTSGSTGAPKGALNTHRGICNRLLWMQDALQLASDDRVLQKTPFSFDVSVWEFFWPLLCGARLVLARPGGQRDSGYLAGLIEATGITTVHFVPSLLAAFLEEPGLERCRDLRRVVCSGEALPAALAARAGERLPGAALYNLYGPTEAAVDVTWAACRPGERRPGVPIGRPIANTQVYVLDRRLRPVPIGVLGELYLGGVGLARGYLGQPGLTAERFVPDPCGLQAGGRLYRSGDVGRWLPGGELEFVGRADGQAKVRGVRVEPGEVEAALTRHPEVREAAVLARADGGGPVRLVAYVVAAGPSGPGAEDLRRFLGALLPDYLVPSAFVAVAALPRTPSGKVDRRALPAPGPERPALEGAYVAPRTPAEQLLADIWAQVLGVRPVGVEDNFFSLGGDSIRSLQVLDLARRRGLAFDLPQLFRHQTVAALAAEVGQAGLGSEASAPFGLISPADRALLPADVEDAYPLAQLQAGMLFHSELAPHSNMYHNTGGSWIRTRVPFCEAAFREAVQRTVDRHPVFRTSFDFTHYSEPLQLVHRTASFAVEVVDLRHLPFEEQEVLLGELLESEKRRPFDLSRPGLLRFFIHLRTEDTFQFTITECHAIFDGWSYHSMFVEVFNCYAALLRNEPLPEEPAASLAYRDFVALEQVALKSEGCRSYWAEKLSGCTPLRLPRRSLPARPSAGPEVRTSTVEVPAHVYEGLMRSVKSQGVPLKSLVLAAHAKVLSLVSGQEDVLTGMCTNGRPEEVGGEKVFGLFLNTVPVRLRLGGGSWVELARQAFEAERELLPFRRYPLAAIQKGWGRQPLCDEVQFNYMDFHVYDDLDPSLDLELLGGKNSEGTNFRLVVHVLHLHLISLLRRNQLTLQFDYDATALCEEQIKLLAGYYVRALGAIAEAPWARHERACLLSPEERRQVLEGWNNTEAQSLPPQCLHRLFEAQVDRTPKAVAVACAGQELTYRELNARANQLAHHLQGLGVRPGVLVGVYLEQSAELVVGLLGALKAGAAYVPLDPELPAERLAFLVDDARVTVLLTRQRLAERLPPHLARIVSLDVPASPDGADEAANPCGGATADDLVYVIYTSGSTGTPKGVMVPHRGLCNYLNWCLRAYPIGQGCGTPLHSSIAFDLSVTSLWAPLLAGQRVVLIPPAPGAEALAEALRAQLPWSLVKVTPAHLQILSRQFTAAEAVGRALALVIGGEALTAADIAFWQAAAPETALVNEYGPTEAVVGCCVYTLPAGPPPAGPIPIGRPIANAQMILLDRHGQLVPPGTPGEVHIGGPGLAWGYLHRPELTAERFVPHPFGREPGSRLYRTGDLARQLQDGNFEFLGRTDDQVKVRGFRIEPGEVEAALLRHPAVRQAVVVARDVAPGARQLVAYVVADPARCPSVSELRRFIQAGLPEYMVPAAFVVCEALPLTPHGKVDRRALPEPGPERPALEGAYVAPRTPAEQVLADIWAQVLRLERVGVEDNFFELGGDSIISLQMVSRARAAGLRLPRNHVFQSPTIAQLAAAADATPVPPAAQDLVTGPVPLTPIQHWFFEQDQTEPHHYNHALLCEVRCHLTSSQWERAVERLLEHHDALRLRFRRTESGWQQANAGLSGAVPLVWLDLSGMPEHEHEAAVAAAGGRLQAGLDLAVGPLLRVLVADRGKSKPGWLLLVIHHLAVDGVSWRILREDLEALCGQLQTGEPLVLPPKTVAFRWWAERLVPEAQSPALHAEREYWLRVLRSPGRPLPRDEPAGANTAASARSVAVTLSEAETRALLQEVPRAHGARINVMLLTALVQTFTRLTGTPVLRLDVDGHGREGLTDDIDLSRTVGWFTALFPLFLDISGLEGPVAALQAVKEQLQQVPRHGIGYGLLCYLSGDADLTARRKAVPPAEVSFNYLGQFAPSSSTALLGPPKPPPGPARSPRQRRSHLLEVDALVAEGQLRVTWTYSANVHRNSTVEAWANGFLKALRDLSDHCRRAEVGDYAPSDFPLAGLTQHLLDELGRAIPPFEAVYPLSPLQQGMLYHGSRSGQSEYFLQRVLVVQGPLSVPAFEQAWQEVVRRHPVLRTLVWTKGVEEPLQVVSRRVALTVAEHDWRGVVGAAREEELRTFLRRDRQQGFHLAVPPLMRLTLLRVGDAEYYFVWSYLHLLVDGWSTALVLSEVFARYDALERGTDLHGTQPRPFQDYIAWLRGQDLPAAERFWREALAGFSTPTPLGIDRIRPPGWQGEDEDYGEEALRLPASTRDALQALARRHQLTLNTVIQGAWAILLSRCAGQEEVVFGVTVAGRPAEFAGVEAMVGPFINTLPLRVRVPPAAPLVPWLHDLQARTVRLRDYEYTPLVEVQGWSDVPRRRPLFDSIFVFDNYPVEPARPWRAGNLEIKDVSSFERTNYPLTVMAAPGPELLLKVLGDRGRFQAGALSRLLGHWHTLLEGMAADPQRPLGELPLLRERERDQLLAEWNSTATVFPEGGCLHHLVEAQAARTPEGVAVQWEGGQLSYRELNARANRLAHHLLRNGVGPEVCVGLCVERSPEMLIGILGALKAGGAYVPLDPDYPRERLAFLFDDARVPVVLTKERLLERLPRHSARVLCLDRDWEAIALEGADDPSGGAGPDNLAYVIYTSGSTGRPKGVAITHRGLTNYLAWAARVYAVAGGAGAPVQSSVAFDATITSLFTPLIAGRAVELLPEGQESEALCAALCSGRNYSLVKLTPTHLDLLAQLVPGRGAVGPTRAFVVGGEALTGRSLAFWRSHAPGTRLINEYGPTETVVGCCAYEVPAQAAPTENVPIGRPIANTQVYLLDGRLRPVPVGIPGELYVGGAGLARGYLNSPALTAVKFIPHPFSDAPGARLYKTGDLARRLPDGDLEFLGRLDQQVKVSGFRIELGEVEAALRQHPAVQQAVVLAREDVPGESLLVAYVVAPAALPASEWRRFLREKLPDYMIPSAFLLLPGLPLTPNGKLDRNALPAPDRARLLAEEAFVAPRTSAEEMLAGIWAEVLGVERVGAHDNFFDLGGHSLKATRVLARVQDAFQVQLSLASLFDNPTVADLAEAVARAPRGAAHQGPALVPVPRGGHRVRATSAGVENLDGLEEQGGQEFRKR